MRRGRIKRTRRGEEGEGEKEAVKGEKGEIGG